jgi:transposase
VAQIRDAQARIATLEAEIAAWCRRDDASRRLATIPGVGPITATAMAATDPSCFSSGRQLAAWLGLVPRQNSSGGKQRLAGISKQGDRYLRRLLVVGARTVIRYARSQAPVGVPWIVALLGRRPALVAAVALANKMARIAWAILARGEVYRPAAVASN